MLPPLVSFAEPLAGGAMIGLAAGGLRLATGEIAGISGIARRALQGPHRDWRIAFVAGLLIAGAVAVWWRGPALAAGIEQLSLARVGLAGLLVGLGTGIGNGCTSGHGICGLARFSRRSLAAVPVFMGSAGLVVLAGHWAAWP